MTRPRTPSALALALCSAAALTIAACARTASTTTAAGPAPAQQPAPQQPAAGRGGGGARGGGGGGGAGRGGAPAGPTAGLPITPRPEYVRTTPPSDPVIQRMWTEGMERSQSAELSQVLMDSIGPRLTGSPGMKRASDWVISKYRSWGITARAEQYGTWNNWERGTTHLDLIAPRVRSLEAIQLAWSPGTDGRPVEGEVILLPDSSQMSRWNDVVRGKFILTGAPQPSCRMTPQLNEFATEATQQALAAERQRLARIIAARNAATGITGQGAAYRIQARLKEAGALGVLASNWSQYPGIDKIFGSPQQVLPTVDVSCEDYGLLFRMAERNQRPRVRYSAESRFLGEQPVFNTIGEIRGSTRPNEYIVLSAHFDSWDGSSGATDNGTGTITMMEAMRILKTVYPSPKRTIIVGHWSGEEQGLNGSRAFSEDHPEIVRGLHALFNQDNGTGRIVNTGPGLLVKAGPVLRGYMSQIPSQITQYINIGQPSTSAPSGGSDHASFACYGAPAFSLGALSWDYSNTTWHTNRDTYDKIAQEDLRNNATLTAMLVYLASEDPTLMPRDLNVVPATGQPPALQCTRAVRRSADSSR